MKCHGDEGIQCNIGNALFALNPQLTDIISVTEQTTTDTNGLQDDSALQSENDLTLAAEQISDLQQDSSRVTELISGTSAKAPEDAVCRVMTRKEAAKCTQLDKPSVAGDGHEISLQDVNDTDSDTTTGAAADDSHLEETVRQLSNIDMSEIDAQDENKQVSLAATEFREAQIQDPSLSAWWTRAKLGSSDFRIIDGLLYKLTPPNIRMSIYWSCHNHTALI